VNDEGTAQAFPPTSAATSTTSSTQAPPTTTSSLLSPATLHGIMPLDLRARIVADALFAGGHRSRRFGSSTEFAEHKVYTPGDDLRRLDWRVMGRLDKSYVRRTEDETRTDVVIVVDTSGSMAYAGGARGSIGASKLDVARTLAAAVAWIALHQQDAPGVSLFAGQEHASLPARGRGDALGQIGELLIKARAEGPSALATTLQAVTSRLRRKTVVVVVSDLIDAGPESLSALGVLRRRGGDAIVLQVLHDDELDFPFDGVVKFEDLEGDREVQVDAPLVRRAYLDELAVFRRDCDRAAAACDARLGVCRVNESVVEVLAAVLDDRRGRR
jgi:uncharacterized protein (DUF58 family)